MSILKNEKIKFPFQIFLMLGFNFALEKLY